MQDEQLNAAINRLYRVKFLHEAYRERKPDARETQFLGSCIDMLEKRGYVTGGMQSWLDSLLDKGPPAAATEEMLLLAEQLESASQHAGARQAFMQDMASRLRSGTALTEKQDKLAQSVLARVNRAPADAPLTEREMRALSMAQKVLHGYSIAYRMERPGSFGRAQSIIDAYIAQGTISRVDWDDLTSIIARLRELAYPRYESGKLVHLRNKAQVGIVYGLPEVDHAGLVKYNVLIDGVVSSVEMTILRSRVSNAA
jgi:hypothetical protein